jgi:pimeloyl-ACP methyl ester carboxylesterase
MLLNSKMIGQGPPLVILHGLFGTLDNWQTLAKQWAQDYTVVLIDLRNHGRSPHVDTHDYPAMAHDVKEFLENHFIYETHLLGHSMGGKAAMQFAADYPDMLAKLVVVDIAPKVYPGGHEVILDALSDLDLATITERSEADDHLARRIPEPGIRQFLLKNLTRSKDGGFEWKMNLPVLLEYYTAILDNVVMSAPYPGETLFVRGARSNYIEDADVPTLQQWFPASQLVTIPDAGHWVHAEQPDALRDVVSEFLKN